MSFHFAQERLPMATQWSRAQLLGASRHNGMCWVAKMSLTVFSISWYSWRAVLQFISSETKFIRTEHIHKRHAEEEKYHGTLCVTISNYSSFGLEFPTHTLRADRSRLSAWAAGAGLHAWKCYFHSLIVRCVSASHQVVWWWSRPMKMLAWW